MIHVVLLACLALGCLAQVPHPCKSPPLMTGSLTITSQDEQLVAYAKYFYDAFGQRVRLFEIGNYGNKTFSVDVLLLFREGIMYKINDEDKSCTKEKLAADFHPMEIPKDATLLGQAIVGSSSGPGQGLLVNTWRGEMKRKQKTAKYMSTVTEFGCIPVSTLFHTEEHGWMLSSFFDNVIGVEDPQTLLPPPFCQGLELEDTNEPDDFYSIFFKKH
ncbi:ependymin-like [Aplochiton taeniatus]